MSWFQEKIIHEQHESIMDVSSIRKAFKKIKTFLEAMITRLLKKLCVNLGFNERLGMGKKHRV